LSNWSEIFLGQLELDPDFHLHIPVDLLPGETIEEATIRYFVEQGVFIERTSGIYDVDLERARKLDSNIYKLVKAWQDSQIAEIMEVLEQDGYAYSTLDDAGDLRYALTPEGVRYLEELNSKDN
jgi:hypothetical protein